MSKTNPSYAGDSLESIDSVYPTFDYSVCNDDVFRNGSQSETVEKSAVHDVIYNPLCDSDSNSYLFQKHPHTSLSSANKYSFQQQTTPKTNVQFDSYTDIPPANYSTKINSHKISGTSHLVSSVDLSRGLSDFSACVSPNITSIPTTSSLDTSVFTSANVGISSTAVCPSPVTSVFTYGNTGMSSVFVCPSTLTSVSTYHNHGIPSASVGPSPVTSVFTHPNSGISDVSVCASPVTSVSTYGNSGIPSVSVCPSPVTSVFTYGNSGIPSVSVCASPVNSVFTYGNSGIPSVSVCASPVTSVFTYGNSGISSVSVCASPVTSVFACSNPGIPNVSVCPSTVSVSTSPIATSQASPYVYTSPPINNGTSSVSVGPSQTSTSQPTNPVHINGGLSDLPSCPTTMEPTEDGFLPPIIYDLWYDTSRFPIKWQSLQKFLRGYNPARASKVISSLKEGVHLYSTLTDSDGSSDTHIQPSALEHPDIVDAKLQEELAQGRIAGPFSIKPQGLIVSPLALVPKKEPNSYRIIHNLSFPHNASVNSHTPKELTTVSYETLDHCVSIIAQLGRGCLVSKTDIRNAFRIIPVHKSDFRLLGFYWKDSFWFEMALPMGASSSCHHFEELTKSLQWILINKLHVQYVSHILDDFMFFGPPNSHKCYQSLQAFLTLADTLNIPIKHSKTVNPTTVIELHGIQVSTDDMELSLPLDKIHKALNLIDQMSSCQKATIGQVQSLVGFLSFCTKIIPAGRAFLRRLIELIQPSKPQWYKVRVNRPIKQDLQVWKSFLLKFNGRSVITPEIWCQQIKFHLFTDASGEGYSGILGKRWFNGYFPPSWKSVNIAIKEFVPVYLCYKLWSHMFRESICLFHTDNMSCVYIVMSQTSYVPQIMDMLREMVLHAMFNNIQFQATHIPGRLNKCADLLSRFQVQRALELYPELNPTPMQLPPEWLPWK